MPASDAAKPVRVAVAWSAAAGTAVEVELELKAGATVLDALRALAAMRDDAPPLPASDAPNVGIWGRACTLDAMLRSGDRVEIYRPLTMSAGEARRRRAAGRKTGS